MTECLLGKERTVLGAPEYRTGTLEDVATAALAVSSTLLQPPAFLDGTKRHKYHNVAVVIDTYKYPGRNHGGLAGSKSVCSP
jgi:hypothetical protein